MRPNSKLPALHPLNQSYSPRLPSDQRRHSARRVTAYRSVIGEPYCRRQSPRMLFEHSTPRSDFSARAFPRK
jgi:hypothetical protein